MGHEIRPGQVYEHVRYPKSIRITDYQPGTTRADAVDAVTGKRPRSILVSELHSTGTTASGQPRRTGYRLVSDTEER